ncbi:UDP-glucose 4-epimerase GalE [Gammaproteobacteria bacterium]|nr:UDP-glucose 4-epimerase GalE [Gammaproteobacteria bacterium]MDC0402165.1 UDP-glucose 4-epimerase GalE [Gammaproteobacteria bacterium]
MNSKKNKLQTILVTGGSGYIGGMVCILLVEAGYSVINIDRVKREIPGVKQYVIDINDNNLNKIIVENNPSSIMHFAADHEVGKSVTSPDEFYNNNVGNTFKLLNLAVKCNIKNFIFSSTSAVYGDINLFPTNEKTPKAPISPYGKSKSMIEDALEDYANAYNFKYVAFRYFNAAGASPDLKHGYTQKPANHIVPVVAQKILSGKTIEIFGNDFDTKDGTTERDYIHVYDIATAHLCALSYLDKGMPSEVFNIGANRPNSVLEVVEAFKKLIDKEISYKFVNRRPGDTPKTWADSSKAMKKLNWKPRYDLNDIVEHAFLWEKHKGNHG